MSSLKIRETITPTLTGVILATALGSASINTYANKSLPHNHEAFYKVATQNDLNKTAKTFSALELVNSSDVHEVDNLMLQVFEKISKNSKPMDPEFARILSDNILDLF